MGLFWDKNLYGGEIGTQVMDMFEKMLAQVVAATRETRVEDVVIY